MKIAFLVNLIDHPTHACLRRLPHDTIVPQDFGELFHGLDDCDIKLLSRLQFSAEWFTGRGEIGSQWHE